MGSKNKLKRFKENESFKNVIQPSREEVLDGLSIRGEWHSFFGNNNPIILELGCGKGEYSVSLAEKYPEKNFIGVDIKGARFWRGAKTAIENNLENVAFLRTQIELIDSCFGENEISEIWITFPDPQIKYKRTKHRLITRPFLEKYQHILANEGVIHLKTDSEFLHGYLLGLLHEGNHEVLYAHHDIYNSSSPPEEATAIQTFYENQYLEIGKSITYTKFRIKY
ncbi:tRNA (guanosine(46)-N7)-methyltransferase TrmB [Lutimonas saemankumensis]|uniref:tRNA (guanosine(46)-N7)-methyltransferase TrmB n=1 Tax=Lutimonas saemankumensis TaxID=483016 RepID=UPI001CD3626C|nr:tRNA (guanosine(46)-N7)-methyltransferase TrmB [Lutimonas saemankumensis]MCA0932897.1 tRNA (guanosine(46)-N7)-methyltransferase TrmB [Lutimonas saemankumensis]